MTLLSMFQDPNPRFSKVVSGPTTSELFWSQHFEKPFAIKWPQTKHSGIDDSKKKCSLLLNMWLWMISLKSQQTFPSEYMFYFFFFYLFCFSWEYSVGTSPSALPQSYWCLYEVLVAATSISKMVSWAAALEPCPDHSHLYCLHTGWSPWPHVQTARPEKKKKDF